MRGAGHQNDPWCPGCGAPRSLQPGESLRGIPLVAIGVYEGALARAVCRLKYDSCPALARPLALELVPRLRDAGIGRGCVIAPVPLHPRRLVERGFNQSALVARTLSSALGCSTRPRLLRRVRETRQQADLDQRARAQNAAGAFAAASAIDSPIVLLDDVVTTGATAIACIEVLESMDMNVVAVASLARAALQAAPLNSHS